MRRFIVVDKEILDDVLNSSPPFPFDGPLHKLQETSVEVDVCWFDTTGEAVWAFNPISHDDEVDPFNIDGEFVPTPIETTAVVRGEL